MTVLRRNGKLLKRDGVPVPTTNWDYLQRIRAKKAAKGQSSTPEEPALPEQLEALRKKWDATPKSQPQRSESLA